MAPLPGRRHIAAAAALLLVASVAVYAPGLRGPFLLDDFGAIFPLAENFAGGLGWWDSLRFAPSHIQARWLSNLSFLLTQAAAGADLPPQAFAYKLGNLLVHLATTAMVAVLARALSRRWGADGRRQALTALLAAGLFALHPLLVSTVLYPVQRMAQLPTLFLLLSAWSYLRWRERLAQASTSEHAVGLVLVLGYAALALLAKENGVLAPLLIGAIELTAFRWPAGDSPERQRFETGFGLCCAAPLVLGAIALVVRWPKVLAGYGTRDFTLPERLLTELHVLADYLGQIFWPRIAGMGLYRDDFPLTTAVDAATLALALAGVALLAAALALRRRWPAWSLAVLWFCAAHALESTVISLELVFEHRNYLALFGPVLAVAWTLTGWQPRFALPVAGLILVVLAVQTGRRASDWSSYDRWIRSEAGHHPGSLRAGSDLVAYLAGRRQAADAEAALRQLDARFPDHAQPVIVGLLLRCPGAQRAEGAGLGERDLQRLREGRIAKDAFHVFAGLQDRLAAGRCPGLDWPTLAAAAGAVVANPRVTARATPAAAWHRLHARALAESGDWAGTAAALESALGRRGNDPRDWLLLMRARLQLGDLPGYGQARNALLRLVGGNPGRLSAEFATLERMAAGLSREPAD